MASGIVLDALKRDLLEGSSKSSASPKVPRKTTLENLPLHLETFLIAQHQVKFRLSADANLESTISKY